jgi:exonuclease VII small subunit
MKKLIITIPFILLFQPQVLSQIDEIIEKVKESNSYYEAGLNKIKKGEYHIKHVRNQTNLNIILDGIEKAYEEILNANRLIKYTRKEVINIAYQANEFDCEDVDSKLVSSEGNFDEAIEELDAIINKLEDSINEEDIDYISRNISKALKYINSSVNYLELAMDDLAIGVSFLYTDCSITIDRLTSNPGTCESLKKFIIENAEIVSSIEKNTLNSSWLDNVTAFEYNNDLYVIISIRENNVSYKSNEYIFCGIPHNNWNSFRNKAFFNDSSYGERFHEYIFEYKCNCN